MRKLISFAFHRRGLMIVAFCFIAVIGYYAWKQLSIDAYPDIADVTVEVSTQVPGLASEEIEQQITIPIERALNGLPGTTVMRSRSSFGISTITLVFEDGVDDYWARQRVQERLADVELPYNAIPELEPLTSPIGEIYRYVIESKTHSLRELTDINKWVVIPHLKQVVGVADVSNFGGITTQYQIEIDPHKMEQYDVTLSDIKDKIEKNNVNAGGSILQQGDLSYVIRGIGLIKNLDDLGRIVISSKDGVPVYLNDIGTLKYGNLERKGVFGFCDKSTDIPDGVEGSVQMLRFQNPSKVLEGIHQTVDELNHGALPPGVTIHPFMDRTQLVDTTLHTVSHTLIEGMLLVLAVLFIYLGNWKGAAIVALTIPLSLLISFILMHLTGIPANLLSLGAVDFGILVDGSIVMMETILKKRENNPLAKLEEESILKRTMEVVRPILFSTLIIITAYLPLFTFEHIEKKLFTPMAYTVGYALIGAMCVSFFLTPGLSYLIYRKPYKIYKNKWLERLSEIYHHQTLKILSKPKKVLAPFIIILILAAGLSWMIGKDFLPPLDEGSIWVQMELPPGISMEKSKQMSADFRKEIRKFDEVSYVMTQLGRDDQGTDAFSLSHVECCIGLKPYNTWKSGLTKAQLIEKMSDAIQKMPGYTIGFSQPILDMVMDQVAGAHSDLALKIYGEDLGDIRRVGEQIVKTLQQVKGAKDVTIDQEPPLPQLQIIANRNKIAMYGLNISDVADVIEMAIGGSPISEIFMGSKSYDVTCKYDEASRNTPEKIGNLMLTTNTGVKIPLSQVATIKLTSGASCISREMNKRHLTVRVNLRGVDLTTFLKNANHQINKNINYNRQKINLQWGGQFQNQQRAYSKLAVVIPLTLGIMLLLLFIAFGKFRQALLQMSVIPLALFGGMLALNLRGMTFNVSSAVGFIALIGVAIQNGVIMVSHINDLRKKGKNLHDAVVEGSMHRFRPIIMTATVAVLGLFPASVTTGIGSDVQRPLATVIVYGLLFSTVITLYILPALYYMIEKRQEKIALNKNNSIQKMSSDEKSDQ
jgi:heavy metal efflux system protein